MGGSRKKLFESVEPDEPLLKGDLVTLAAFLAIRCSPSIGGT
jgi:hypothetical protein